LEYGVEQAWRQARGPHWTVRHPFVAREHLKALLLIGDKLNITQNDTFLENVPNKPNFFLM